MVVGKLPDEVRPVPRRSVTFTVRQFLLGAKAMKRLAVSFIFMVDHLRLTGGCGFPAAGWSQHLVPGKVPLTNVKHVRRHELCAPVRWERQANW